MSKRNVDLVRSLYAAWSRGDVEAFLQVLAPDVEWRFADSFIYGAVNPVIGRDALRKGVTKWRQYVDQAKFAEAVTETPTTTERSDQGIEGKHSKPCGLVTCGNKHHGSLLILPVPVGSNGRLRNLSQSGVWEGRSSRRRPIWRQFACELSPGTLFSCQESEGDGWTRCFDS